MSIGALPTPRVTFHNRGFRRGAGDTLQPEDTMADNDFVERLRIRWETMGDMANDERAAAAAEIESLRSGQREMMRTIAKLTTERDEARRLLKAVVDMMRDNMAHDATHPHHLCDFIHRPDIGMCKVCEDWTDAMVMCYPDDFQDEEDGK